MVILLIYFQVFLCLLVSSLRYASPSSHLFSPSPVSLSRWLVLCPPHKRFCYILISLLFYISLYLLLHFWSSLVSLPPLLTPVNSIECSINNNKHALLSFLHLSHSHSSVLRFSFLSLFLPLPSLSPFSLSLQREGSSNSRLTSKKFPTLHFILKTVKQNVSCKSYISYGQCH